MVTQKKQFKSAFYLIFIVCGFLHLRCDQVKEFFGMDTGVKNHLDICLDITLADNLDYELKQDSSFVAHIIQSLGPGDALHIYPIHKMALIRQEKIFQSQMPLEVGPAEGILKENRNQALNDFKKHWRNGLNFAIEQGYDKATDLVGLFQHLQTHIERVPAKTHKIIVCSDMQDVAPGKWNFEKKPPDSLLLDKWEQDGLIPNLQDKDIFVFRVYPAHGISKGHHLKIKSFWEMYFRKAQANLLCYQYERDESLVFK